MWVTQLRLFLLRMISLLARWCVGSLGSFGNLLQSLQLSDHSSQLISNAIPQPYLDKPQTSQSISPLSEANNSNKCKTFLCDYQFRGGSYSIHVVATSWEEAEEHVRSIAKSGKIIGGPVALTIKIPFT
jgi:hypothetical protein